MRDRRPNAGYALLSALVVAILAAIVCAVCVAALAASGAISQTDRGAARADAAGAEALREATDRLRWSPRSLAGSAEEAAEASSWMASWEPAEPSADGAPCFELSITSRTGQARREFSARVALQSESCAQGVLVGGDALLSAPMVVAGSGLCTGGFLLGREWLSFAAEPGATQAADTVHAELWPLAGVHAFGSIWARGAEIHEAGALDSASWAADTDSHSESASYETRAARDKAQPPGRGLVTALRERSLPAGEAIVDDVLDVSELPGHSLGERAGEDCQGIVLVVRPAGETALTITGERPASDCPLVLVVDGDAAIGWPGAPRTRTNGAILVTGTLRIRSPLDHSGHVFAGHLKVTAAARIDIPPDWRTRPLCGLAQPTIVALGAP